MSPLYHPTRQQVAPGHVYKDVIRCGLCDYVQEIAHSGPNLGRGPRWSLQLRECPICKAKGIRSFMERSRK